jgi:Na+/phosphate symporter
VLIFCLLFAIYRLVSHTSAILARQIANAHTIFNVIVSLIMVLSSNRWRR